MLSFFKYFIITFSILITSIIGFNYFVNPYAYFESISLTGINEKKLLNHDRRREVYEALSKTSPKTLILGTSRSLMGFEDMQFSNYPNPVINASVERASFYEMSAYFDYALQQSTLSQVIITLDLFSFNAMLKPLPGFNRIEHMMSSSNQKSSLDSYAMSYLFSKDALYKSIHTLYHNLIGERRNETSNAIDALSLSNKTERSLLTTNVLFPLPLKQFKFIDDVNGVDTFELLQKMIHQCNKKNIKIDLVILPIHARQMILLDEVGLWDIFQEWQDRITQLSGNYQLIDVQYLKGVSDLSPSEPEFKVWYYETLHFKPIVGDEVLKQMQFTPQSVQTIKYQKSDLNRYKSRYPKEYEAIKANVQVARY